MNQNHHQTLHLTGLMHSLMLVPYDLVWVVVEAGGTSNETASILEKSRLQTIHVGFVKRCQSLGMNDIRWKLECDFEV